LGTGSLSGNIDGTGRSRAVVGYQSALGGHGPNTAAWAVVSAGSTDGICRDLFPTNVTVEVTSTFHSNSGTTVRGTLRCLRCTVVLDRLATTIPNIIGIVPSNVVVETHRAFTAVTIESRPTGTSHGDTLGG